ncbi:MAG: CCA tRNA nucleotidyltransferase [Spirochaetia bacterium]|nr:CCA tRNA nucleotidyltransferase [Spirochaetia bacterium]
MLLIPSQVKEFAGIVSDAGFKIYLVGGAVRNIKRGVPPVDYDFTTNAMPQQIMALFRKVIPTGIEHGTVTVLFKGYSFEITTFRIDGKYNDSRHPDSVAFSDDIYEDLKRRDFTINAMALDVLTGELIDAHSGAEDLKNGVIRAIGNPEERFAEDGLRILRACRFAAQLGFSIDPDTLKGMHSQRHHLEGVSSERIRDEVLKSMTGDRPSVSFLYMQETSVLEYVLPELLEGVGMEQRERHKFDVFHHNLFSCDFMEKDPILRMTALLHDIGKPRTFRLRDGVPTFYCHEKVSAQMAGSILQRLKFPNADIRRICHLIENHMFNYTDDWSDGAVRRFVARVGRENISDLFKLRFADRAGSMGSTTYACTPEDIALARRIDLIVSEATALGIKDLAVNGNVLNQKAGIPKGPAMGQVLNFLLEAVMEDPSQNTRETLLDLGRNFYRTRIDL